MARRLEPLADRPVGHPLSAQLAGELDHLLLSFDVSSAAKAVGDRSASSSCCKLELGTMMVGGSSGLKLEQ